MVNAPSITRSLLALVSCALLGACVDDTITERVAAGPSADAVQATEADGLMVLDDNGVLSPLVLAGDETAWIEPDAEHVFVDDQLPDDAVEAVCARTTLKWSEFYVTHSGWVCNHGAACTPTVYWVWEKVQCSNTCVDPETYSCTALGAFKHGGHATTFPTHAEDIACMTPCGALSTCSGCF
jgi:hypothetical protein